MDTTPSAIDIYVAVLDRASEYFNAINAIDAANQRKAREQFVAMQVIGTDLLLVGNAYSAYSIPESILFDDDILAHYELKAATR